MFQRTATWSVPAWNESLTPEYLQAAKADYPALRAKARGRPTGFYFPFNMKPALEAAPEERERQYEEAWERGGLPFLGAFGDLLFEKAANDTIADFARRKIREHREGSGHRRPAVSGQRVRLQAALRRYRATSKPTICRT